MARIHYIISGALIALILLSGSLFTVDQRQYAVVFQFGEAVRFIKDPGLNMKIPFIQTVDLFDKRILNVSADAKELTAADEKRVIVDAFAKFHIVDPIAFYKTVHNVQGLNIRLNKILESSMRRVIGRASLNSLLTEARSDIMSQIHDIVNDEAKNFGVNVLDVRILRADLPKENSAAIYSRMQTEREKEAKQIRAEGKEEEARIRSTADKESKIILAEAYTEAEITKGDGDSKAAQIFNQAFAHDPEFYKFYKSLLVYKSALQKDDTSFVISPDSEFFKYLNLR